MKNWISVEERLPEMDVDVLAFVTKVGSVCDINRKLGVRILKRLESESSGNVYWFDGGSHDTFWTAEKCVTHWMPLPDSPQG